jgi:hypothetical protein
MPAFGCLKGQTAGHRSVTSGGIQPTNGCFAREAAIQKSVLPLNKVNPLLRHRNPDEVSAVEPDNDEGIEQIEADGRYDKQVHGGNLWRVVTQEGPPSLAGRPSPFDHVLGDARLRDLKTELEQFTMIALRTPKWIFDAHPPDPQLRVESGVALPMGATSNASSSESRPCANARVSRAG